MVSLTELMVDRGNVSSLVLSEDKIDQTAGRESHVTFCFREHLDLSLVHKLHV